MKITMLETTKHEIALNTRMPFRYGIVSMTALPHLFVRVLLDVDGTRRWGMAADHLPPKWFTKNPQSSLDDDVAEMREVIDRALAIAASAGTVHTVFDLWKKIYDDQKRWAQHTPYPPLLWGFGVSLVERAVIDAFCRATKMPFARALRENLLGIRLETIYPELEGLAPADFLPRIPPAQIYVRHTVGLIDTLREKDIALTDRLDDGLPQSLEAAIRAYGLTHFKIKLAGDPDKDFAWLLRVADVLDNAKTD
ncbi:MAG: hypothetical protein FJY97_01310, partial [candidate division Zixibacteria bacterium]|nr:hypothetical protein [candidate division Zixibacteria bacterium]